MADSGVVKVVLGELSKGLSRLLGAGDDTVGFRSEEITSQRLTELADKPDDPNPGVPVPADYSFFLGSDSEGVYQVFFNTRWL